VNIRHFVMFPWFADYLTPAKREASEQANRFIEAARESVAARMKPRFART
jgi:hypothetical protein